MKRLIFATGNQRKIQEATTTLALFNISLEHQSVDINEIQHDDPTEIAKAKACAAYEVIQQPVVVSDTSWSIPALGGFPGGYMKDVADWWQPDDWLQIMARHDDKTIYCHEYVAYFDGEELRHFMHSYQGYFTSAPDGTYGVSIEKVVCLYGNQTLSEMHDAIGIASAGETLHHWQQFGKWFSKAR